MPAYHTQSHGFCLYYYIRCAQVAACLSAQYLEYGSRIISLRSSLATKNSARYILYNQVSIDFQIEYKLLWTE